MRTITVLVALLALSGALLAQDIEDLDDRATALGGEVGEWEDLLNGEDLTGWERVKGHTKESWSVEDGILTNVCTHDDRGSDLGTERLFQTHQVHVEFCVPEGGNSGVYLQGRYECQIADTASAEKPTMGQCGGIWRCRTRSSRPPSRPANGRPTTSCSSRRRWAMPETSPRRRA